MRAQRLSKRIVEATPADEEAYVWDTEVRGFGLRVHRGRRAYVLRLGGGRRGPRRWITIGEHGGEFSDPETGEFGQWTVERARERARVLKAAAAQGKDPASDRERLRAMPTVAEWGATYLREGGHAEAHKAPATVKGERYHFAREIAPAGALGSIRLDQLTTAQVADWHLARAKTPRQANHLLSILKTMLNHAIDVGQLPRDHRNPCAGVRRYQLQKRARSLSRDERSRLGLALMEACRWCDTPLHQRPGGSFVVHDGVRYRCRRYHTSAAEAPPGSNRWVWTKVPSKGPWVRTYADRPTTPWQPGRLYTPPPVSATATSLRALLVVAITGARPHEIVSLDREQDVLRDARLALAKAEKGGQRRGHRRPVRLSPEAMALIDAQPRVGRWVFPGRRRGHLSVDGLRTVWHAIRSAAGVAHARLYDLRHTFGSVGARHSAAGIGIKGLADLMGHEDVATTSQYMHSAADALSVAGDAISGEIAQDLQVHKLTRLLPQKVGEHEVVEGEVVPPKKDES